MIQGAVIVTALELCLGTVVNIILGWNVWDYSNMPGNFLGQICPQFTLAWLGLSWVAVHAENLMHKVQDLLSQNKSRKS